MTTKPKAKKFRVRRPTADESAQANQSAAPTQAMAPAQAKAPARPAAAEALRQPPPASKAPPSKAPLSKAPAARPASGKDGAVPRPAPSGTPRPAPGQMKVATAKVPADQARGVTQPAPRTGEVASPQQVASETDIEAIRDEALTGRQLRMARRVAQKHGLNATSDLDAVRLLRARGIDPFQRSNMLELVVPDVSNKTPDANPETKVQLPQTVDKATQRLPSTEVRQNTGSPGERHATEIFKIQRDLAKRRRRKMVLLAARLSFFILLPTFIAGYYYYNVATPMYSTKSEFLILTAETGGGGMGSLFSGTQFATNQDAIAVQSYLTSKDAMLRLDQDLGFKAHYTQPWIDAIQRLGDEPSNEEAYSLYKRTVEIGYDPTEGVVRMEVQAADPGVAAAFSRALIGYAEERVDNLSLRKRDNAVDDAELGLTEAEAARMRAQERLVRLQQEGAIVDPEGRIASLRSQIGTFELQLQEKRLELQALLDNRRPNIAKVEAVQGEIRRLESLLANLNGDMTSAQSGDNSLAETAVQIQLAQADLATRDLMLQTALERLEQARRDADTQARYLTTSVVPVASEDPSYPRKFENTALAFLVFAGIYLMISLTASILREQVSS